MNVIVPTSYAELSLKKFTALSSLQLLDNDPVDYMIDLVSILCDVEYSLVSSLSLVDLKKIYERLNWLNEEVKVKKIQNEIEIKGIKYVANYELEKITANQYIYFKDSLKGGLNTNIHSAMAGIYIPKGKKFNEVPVTEVAGIFYEHMNVATAYPIAVFFCQLLETSMPIIQVSLNQKAEAKIMEAFNHLKAVQ